MICSECWAAVPAGAQKCPRCGAKPTGAPPSVLGLLKSYPWLVVLLSLSLFVTLWAVTRRVPAPEPIPDAIEPAVEPSAPEPVEAEEPAFVPPPMPLPEPAPAPAAEPEPAGISRQDEPLVPTSDGAWRGGPALPEPQRR